LNRFARQKSFYKILLMFVIAISMPAISIGYLAMNYSTAHIIRQADVSSTILLNEKKLYMERQISELVYLTNQIIASDEVWRLFEPNETYPEQAEAMSGVLRFFDKIVSSNKHVASLYLINKTKNYVLSDAKYSLDNFYDPEVLKVDVQGDYTVLPPRTGGAIGASNRSLVSLLRTFRNVYSGESMEVAVNIDYRDFSESLEQTRGMASPMNLLIFDDRDRLILNHSGIEERLLRDQLTQMRNADGTSINRTFGKTDYYLSMTRSDALRWTIVYSQPYEQVVDSTRLLRRVLLSTVLIVLSISLVMAGLFSFYLYRPLALLVADIRRRTNPASGKGKDEYAVIGSAVNTLYQQNRELQSQFDMAYPYIKQHSVFELLSGKVWDEEKLGAVIQLLGISLHKPHYVVAVLDFENTELTDRLIGDIEAFFLENEESMLLSIMSERRLVAIVNSERDKNELIETFNRLKLRLNRGDAELTISVSKIFDSLDKLFLAYQEALQLLNHKFFVGKNEMIVSETIRPVVDRGAFYPKQQEQNLLESIRSQNAEKAAAALASLTSALTGLSYSIDYIKYVIFQVCSNLMDALSEVGGKPEEAGIDVQALWKDIHEADTLARLETLIAQFIQDCMETAAVLKRKQHTETIAKTMDFIERHYREDLSLKEISTNVYLSPGYLSTIFKNETGMTIYDYITQVRMKAAGNLVLDPDVKIQDVALAVGYNNIQSFIRFFKKAYKMTPLEYRRSRKTIG